MLSSHVKYHCCYGYMINHAFHSKQLFQWNGFVFCVEKYFTSLLHSLVKYLDFQHLKRNFVLWSLCSHVISSTSQRTRRVWSRRNTNYLFWTNRWRQQHYWFINSCHPLFPTLFFFIIFLKLGQMNGHDDGQDKAMATWWGWPLNRG